MGPRQSYRMVVIHIFGLRIRRGIETAGATTPEPPPTPMVLGFGFMGNSQPQPPTRGVRKWASRTRHSHPIVQRSLTFRILTLIRVRRQGSSTSKDSRMGPIYPA